MKKLRSVVLLVLVLFSFQASTVAAQAVHDDFIGIYMDETATVNCADLSIGSYRGYVILTEMTGGEVLGWEAEIAFTGIYSGSFIHRGQAIDVGTRDNEHIVGFAEPLLATGGLVVLAEFDFLVLSDDVGYVEIGPIYFSLLDNGLPAYLDGASEGVALNPVDLQPVPAELDIVSSFFVNSGTCKPVANEEISFGAVKGLYR